MRRSDSWFPSNRCSLAMCTAVLTDLLGDTGDGVGMVIVTGVTGPMRLATVTTTEMELEAPTSAVPAQTAVIEFEPTGKVDNVSDTIPLLFGPPDPMEMPLLNKVTHPLLTGMSWRTPAR